MTKEELKKKCTERAKIFQQAMESCHSSNPIDCIEWFADRITELEKENAELKEKLNFSTQYYQGEKAKDQLTKAKELIKRLIKATYGEGWNYSLQVKVEAEQFLKEIEK